METEDIKTIPKEGKMEIHNYNLVRQTLAEINTNINDYNKTKIEYQNLSAYSLGDLEPIIHFTDLIEKISIKSVHKKPQIEAIRTAILKELTVNMREHETIINKLIAGLPSDLIESVVED